VGRRNRRRERLTAPLSDYEDEEGNVLTLRGSLTPKTREAYRATLAGSPLSQEDAWQRATELLFERLAVRWTLAGVPLEGQRELLARFRVATPEERMRVRDALRAHLAEHFPELPAP
jgi:hypothetical protein